MELHIIVPNHKVSKGELFPHSQLEIFIKGWSTQNTELIQRNKRKQTCIAQGNKYQCSNADYFLDFFLLPLQLVATVYVPPKVHWLNFPFFLKIPKFWSNNVNPLLSQPQSCDVCPNFSIETEDLDISLCIWQRGSLLWEDVESVFALIWHLSWLAANECHSFFHFMLSRNSQGFIQKQQG